MALQGSELKVLHTIVREQRDETAGYVADFVIAQASQLFIDEVRDCLKTLEEKECVELSPGTKGLSPTSRPKAAWNTGGR